MLSLRMGQDSLEVLDLGPDNIWQRTWSGKWECHNMQTVPT